MDRVTLPRVWPWRDRFPPEFFVVELAAEHLRITPAEKRRMMVDRQVRTFDVTDQVVVGRMLDVAREDFLPAEQRALAYSDGAIDLAGDSGPRSRVLLPPFLVARMLQGATPQPTDRVIDIAGGTGYTAALLGGLVKSVLAVESDGVLRASAATNFAALGLANVRSVGSLDGAEVGSTDIIVVNGCIEDGWSRLGKLLAPGGRIVAIVPTSSGSTVAALLTGQGVLSIRPLFDAQAPVIPEFRRQPAFVL